MRHRFLFYFKYAYVCMRTGSISWPWTMTTIFSFSFFFFASYVWFYVQYKYERRKKNTREVSREKEKKHRERERENGQLLLFDGQSIDDKDYAIIRLSIVFWSDACLSSSLLQVLIVRYSIAVDNENPGKISDTLFLRNIVQHRNDRKNTAGHWWRTDDADIL